MRIWNDTIMLDMGSRFSNFSSFVVENAVWVHFICLLLKSLFPWVGSTIPSINKQELPMNPLYLKAEQVWGLSHPFQWCHPLHKVAHTLTWIPADVSHKLGDQRQDKFSWTPKLSKSCFRKTPSSASNCFLRGFAACKYESLGEWCVSRGPKSRACN